MDSKTEVFKTIPNEPLVGPMLMLTHFVLWPLLRLRTVIVAPNGIKVVAHPFFVESGRRLNDAVVRTN